MNLMDEFLSDLKKVQPGEQATVSEEGCRWLVAEIEDMRIQIDGYKKIMRLQDLADKIVKGDPGAE